MTPEVAALLQRASQLARVGADTAAIEAYRVLLARDPRLPDSWFNLAMLYRAARRPQDALAAYARALQYKVRGPEEVHLKRGVIFADDLGDSDAAAAELAAALKIAPRYVPALLNLGNLHEDRGDAASARAAYARVLGIEPGNLLALARLAGVSDIASLDHPLIGQLRSALAAPGIDHLDRADLGFALGTVLDRVGDYDAAFAAFTAANRAARAIAKAAGIAYDRDAHAARIDATIAAWPVQPPAAAVSDGTEPLLICGMFRSGSTLAEALLARHPGVVPGGELDVIPAIAHRLGNPAPPAADAAAALREEYLAATASRRRGSALLTDKRPDNFNHIGLVKTMFPAARVIHTVRAPLDNRLSVYFLHAGTALSYATDLADIAHYQAQEARLMAHWRRVFPDAIFTLDYDRLVAEPEACVAELIAFCGLPPEPDLLTRPAPQAAIRTASNWQVRRPLYRTSSGRWHNYRAYLDLPAADV